MSARAFLCACVATLLSTPALAEGKCVAPPGARNEIHPVVLDSTDGQGAAIGLEYMFKGQAWCYPFDNADTGEIPNAEPANGGLSIEYKGEGTLASSAARNPKDFLDVAVDFGLEYDAPITSGLGRTKIGVFIKGETDQSFDNQQVVAGGAATYGKRGFLGRNNTLVVDLNYGRVHAGEDKERKAALGTTNLPDYDRLDVEAEYLMEFPSAVIPTFELNYKIYKEVNPPPQVEAVGLDQHELVTARLGLKGDFFVAYSDGKLPFDRKDDQIFEIGWSAKLH